MLSGDEDAILLDIGGTTTDIFFLADGVPLFEPLGIKIDKYKTLVRAIYSLSIGLGGDSSISIKDGKIKIGPKREGVPYAYGGPAPTPTDAMITLGLMEGEKEKAYEIMKSLGKKLNMSAENISNLILDTMANMIKMKVDEVLKEINSQPVYTVKELLYGKTIEPKLINIIGGPAKVLAPILEKKFHLPPCYYPDKYEVANAVGAALAKPTTEINMLVDTAKGILTVPELNIYENISKKYTLEDAKKKSFRISQRICLKSRG